MDETDSSYDEKLQERLAKLAGGVAVVKVGCHCHETEMKTASCVWKTPLMRLRQLWKKVSFLVVHPSHLAPQLESWATSSLKDEELIGAMIVSRALAAPLKRIARMPVKTVLSSLNG